MKKPKEITKKLSKLIFEGLIKVSFYKLKCNNTN